jgi:hypothetical protein
VHEAWIVGPSARSTFRFIGPTDAGSHPDPPATPLVKR